CRRAPHPVRFRHCLRYRTSRRIVLLAAAQILSFEQMARIRLLRVELGTLLHCHLYLDRSFPFLDGIIWRRERNDVRTNFRVYMLLRLKQGSRRRDPSRIRRLGITHDRDKSLDGRWHVLPRQVLDFSNLLGPSSRIAALALLKWSSNCHAVFL